MKRVTDETSGAIYALLKSLGHRAERYDSIEMLLGSSLLDTTRKVVVEFRCDASDPIGDWIVKTDQETK